MSCLEFWNFEFEKKIHKFNFCIILNGEFKNFSFCKKTAHRGEKQTKNLGLSCVCRLHIRILWPWTCQGHFGVIWLHFSPKFGRNTKMAHPIERNGSKFGPWGCVCDMHMGAFDVQYPGDFRFSQCTFTQLACNSKIAHHTAKETKTWAAGVKVAYMFYLEHVMVIWGHSVHFFVERKRWKLGPRGVGGVCGLNMSIFTFNIARSFWVVRCTFCKIGLQFKNGLL